MVTEHPRPNDQEGRIRAALGLANGPLPKVRGVWLRRYYEYLAARLALPFEAECPEDVSPYQQVFSVITVHALLHPDGCSKHEESGLLCRAQRGTQDVEVPLADVELDENAANYQLIEDYWYWFWNWRFDPQI